VSVKFLFHQSQSGKKLETGKSPISPLLGFFHQSGKKLETGKSPISPLLGFFHQSGKKLDRASQRFGV
jgi:hypothetical protein